MIRHSILAVGTFQILAQALSADPTTRDRMLTAALNGLRNQPYASWRSLLTDDMQDLVRPLLTLPTDAALRVQLVPPGAVAACRSCGAAIVWDETPAGKSCPFDLSGRSHFTTCPYAREHSKRPTKEIGRYAERND